MGNEESHEVPKDAAQSANTKIHATGHYQSPTSNPNTQNPIASFNAANNNQQQANPPGWVMPQQSNNPNVQSQNKMYPNLPTTHDQHTTKPTAPTIPQQPSAPLMFYPQVPIQPKHYYAQTPVASSTTATHHVPVMPTVPSFNAHPVTPRVTNDFWLKTTTKNIPTNSFRAGHDTDGTVIYICRASHNGDVMPGKLIPTHNCAYICYAGEEVPKNEVETLVGDQYRWVPASNGHVPDKAVEGGRTAHGEKLYIGRASHNRSLTPGKLHPSHGCLYIPYAGKEHAFKEYEVLVHLNR